ncbi:hypothetical protein SISSUDRAFT_395100 [Sistotremastrum suecicum HHB10207 ss-3]|uniref:Uncharacterized protein n=1 Tax=Sistotremastrum suecicum HHB10207 ss-3 TaxID=1314776 RepID=A0A165YVP8_9AGAM|nr:hypothetical protein SISSUDRAFT_395100 [Sistotremastrum suecicum HHB10207 ss-3]
MHPTVTSILERANPYPSKFKPHLDRSRIPRSDRRELRIRIIGCTPTRMELFISHIIGRAYNANENIEPYVWQHAERVDKKKKSVWVPSTMSTLITRSNLVVDLLFTCWPNSKIRSRTTRLERRVSVHKPKSRTFFRAFHYYFHDVYLSPQMHSDSVALFCFDVMSRSSLKDIHKTYHSRGWWINPISAILTGWGIEQRSQPELVHELMTGTSDPKNEKNGPGPVLPEEGERFAGKYGYEKYIECEQGNPDHLDAVICEVWSSSFGIRTLRN